MNPMGMPPHPFLPMVPDSLGQPMQNYSPSPITHGPMYDVPGWNMMPIYPISPVQPPPNFESKSQPFQPQKQQFYPTEPHTPIEPMHRALPAGVPDLSIDIDHPARIRHAAGTDVHFNMRDQADAHEYPIQPNGTGFTYGPEENKQSKHGSVQTPTIGTRVGADIYQQSTMSREESWKKTATEQCTDLHSRQYSHDFERKQDGHGRPKVGPPDQPLVVDGSSLQKRPAECLSISLPG